MGLVPAKQAARLLGVPAEWLLAQAKAGQIPAVPLGRSWRFHPEGVAEHFKAHPELKAPIEKPERKRRARRPLPDSPPVDEWADGPALNVAQACEYLHADRASLLLMMESWGVPWVWDGARFRFPRRGLQVWVETKRQGRK